jgi:outer membrane protein assembly factor BamB
MCLACACSPAATSSGHAFTPGWQNDGGKSIAAVQARVRSAALPAGAAVAVGVSKDAVIGASLDGGAPWKHAGRPDTLPVVSGDVVVATSGGKLFALDAKSGKELWSIPSEGRVVRGAGDDGATTVISLGQPAGGGSLLLAVGREGNVRRRIEAEPEIGTPAIQGDVAFVPWQSQYVSAIDLASGDEIGRLLLREQVSHAVNFGGTLYFGERGVVRFDDKIGASAAGGAASAHLPERELPGKPTWLGNGAAPAPAAAGAREKIRLYAMPADQGGTLGFAGGRYAATYFRVAMGLDATDGSLRWVKTFGQDVLGGAGLVDGFAFCDASGHVSLLDSDGGEGAGIDLGAAVVGCVVQGGKHAVTGAKRAGSLPEQIAKAIEVRETEMATVQRFLLRELGSLQEPLVTKALVDLASNPRTPGLLLEDARQLLASRRNGAEYMLAALEQHYDFLSDVLRSPPVGPLADALAAMNETKAAGPLAHHLNDAANTPDDIERAARALSKLATAAELEDLKTFFALYRATADDKELVNAVLSVAQALIRIGGDDGKRIIRDAAKDPLTHPDVKAGLANLAPEKSDSPATPEKAAPEKTAQPPKKKG